VPARLLACELSDDECRSRRGSDSRRTRNRRGSASRLASSAAWGRSKGFRDLLIVLSKFTHCCEWWQESRSIQREHRNGFNSKNRPKSACAEIAVRTRMFSVQAREVRPQQFEARRRTVFCVVHRIAATARSAAISISSKSPLISVAYSGPVGYPFECCSRPQTPKLDDSPKMQCAVSEYSQSGKKPFRRWVEAVEGDEDAARGESDTLHFSFPVGLRSDRSERCDGPGRPRRARRPAP